MAMATETVGCSTDSLLYCLIKILLKMKRLPYFPSSDGPLSLWCKNFKQKIAIQGPTLGLTPAQLAPHETNCDNMIESINAVEAYKADMSAIFKAKELSVKQDGGELKKFIANLKTNPAYTDAIGEDLGIIGAAVTFNPSTYKAEIFLDLNGGAIRIRFRKVGADGINIYKRGKGENQWVFVSRATKSPFYYTPALPDANTPVHLEFRAFGVLNDAEIGIPSDINEILFGE